MTRHSSRRFPHPAELGRALSWHRRKLAVLAAVAAVLVGVTAARPADPPSALVVRAVTALDPGVVVQVDQIEEVRLPRAALPDGIVGSAAEVVGRVLAGPVSRHGVLTTALLRSPRELTRPGRVVAPVRVEDAEVVALVSIGEVIDVVGTDQTGQARVVAAGVRVVALRLPTDPDEARDPDTTLLLVEADRAVATVLAGAASTQRLSLLLRS